MIIKNLKDIPLNRDVLIILKNKNYVVGKYKIILYQDEYSDFLDMDDLGKKDEKGNIWKLVPSNVYSKEELYKPYIDFEDTPIGWVDLPVYK